MLAVLRREPALARVAHALADPEPVMSWVNVGELACVEGRRLGWPESERRLRARVLSAVRAELPDEAVILAAARWKAGGGLSYADAFAVATAERHDAPLLTGDPELVALDGRIRVIDLRA